MIEAFAPKEVFPPDVPRKIQAIPRDIGFSYSGLQFFRGRLYAASNIGLLEFKDGALSTLYKWQDDDDVISGPRLDPSSNSLWMRHEGIERLIRYNGSAWESVEPPRPEEGTTRGDMLAGFRGAGSRKGFWIEGAGHVWRWDRERTAWEKTPTPPTGKVVRAIPLSDRLLFVLRHESLSFLVKEKEAFKSDTLEFFQLRWETVPNHAGANFFIEDLVAAGNFAYARTRNGWILRVTPSEIVRLDAPEDCEAITVTTAGTLLASFRAAGIQEYTTVWTKKFPSVDRLAGTDHWAYLAESEGQVAFALTPQPRLVEGAFVRPGRALLWVSKGTELKPISLGANR